MKVFTLLETDNDTAYPCVGVYATHEEARRVALADIKAGGNEIIEDEEGAILHRDQRGKEFWSVIQEHEV